MNKPQSMICDSVRNVEKINVSIRIMKEVKIAPISYPHTVWIFTRWHCVL